MKGSQLPMNVRLFSVSPEKNETNVVEFLRRNRIEYEEIDFDAVDPRSGWYRCGELPAVEVDGRIFVNPNDEALRLIFELDQAV